MHAAYTSEVPALAKRSMHASPVSPLSSDVLELTRVPKPRIVMYMHSRDREGVVTYTWY